MEFSSGDQVYVKNEFFLLVNFINTHMGGRKYKKKMGKTTHKMEGIFHHLHSHFGNL